MTRFLIFIIVIIGSVMPAMSQRQRTTIKTAKPVAKREFSRSDNSPLKQAMVPEDTLTEASCDFNAIIHLAGYDKPLTASRETLHVKNLTTDTIVSGIQLDITYLDTRGRNLHRRQVWINEVIDPEETRLVTFPTWDIQRSFYYWRSPRPRRLSAPYNVKIKITAITVPLPNFSGTDSKLPASIPYPGANANE